MWIDWTIVKNKKNLINYLFLLKDNFKYDLNEWENKEIESCLEAATSCLIDHGDRNTEFNSLYNCLNYEELKFAAVLLLTASHKTSIEFVQQDVFDHAVLKGPIKGAVFSKYFDEKMQEYQENGIELEDSMNVYFDKLLALLEERTHIDSQTDCAYFDIKPPLGVDHSQYNSVQLGSAIWTFLALILNQGKYYE